MKAPWLLLQLADGTFPNGGFAHSCGLEAAMVLDISEREGAGLMPTFLDASLHQAARAALPFVRAAREAPSELAALDDAFDATLPLLGPNRASRAQGRALASAAARIWDAAGSFAAYAQERPAHHAPLFGAIFGTLGVETDETLAAYLHNSARTLLSAGVRLGLLGPLEAQRLLAERTSLLDSLLASHRDTPTEDAAQTAPLIELFGALHDRLDGRMFQS
jgi:urease accessory protein